MQVRAGDRVFLGPDARRGLFLRMASLWLLRLLTVLSLLAVVPCAILLWLTAKASYHTYLRRDMASVVLNPESAETFIQRLVGFDLPPAVQSTLQWLVGLDLSACSALVVFLTALCLARNGWNSAWSLRSREGAKFWDHAYPGRLFSDAFSLLMVRLGLIGTLVSFVFAALTLIGDMETGAPREEAVAVAPVAEKDALVETTRQTDGNSQKIFLLLCAALVSTLVGSVAAYLVFPFVEAVHSRALGVPQGEEADAEDELRGFGAAVELVNRSLDQTHLRLNSLNAVLQGAGELASKVGAASELLAGLGGVIASIRTVTDSLNATVEGAGQSLQETVGKLGHVAGQLEVAATRLDKSHVLLEKLPSRLQEPVRKLEAGAEALGKMSGAACEALTSLSGMANHVKEPINHLGAAMATALTVLRRILDTLSTLGDKEKLTQRERERMADTFVALETQFRAVVVEVRTLVHQGQSPNGQLVDRLERIEARQPRRDETAALAETLDRLGDALSDLSGQQREERKRHHRAEEDLLKRLQNLEKSFRRGEMSPTSHPRRGWRGWLLGLFGGRSDARAAVEKTDVAKGAPK